MNDFEKWLERIQSANHKTKKIITWVGTSVIMATIIYLWLTYSSFGYTPEESTSVTTPENPSNFEILKNGLNVSIKEIQDLIQTIKDKITRTNSFDIGAANEPLATSTDLLQTSTTSENMEVGTSTINNY